MCSPILTQWINGMNLDWMYNTKPSFWNRSSRHWPYCWLCGIHSCPSFRTDLRDLRLWNPRNVILRKQGFYNITFSHANLRKSILQEPRSQKQWKRLILQWQFYPSKLSDNTTTLNTEAAKKWHSHKHSEISFHIAYFPIALVNQDFKNIAY